MVAARQLIVNADDFGWSDGVNRGVIESYEHGIVTSASLMVWRPAAAEAAAYGREHPELSLGLHVDLGDWTYRDGVWEPASEVVPLDDADAIAGEAARQLERFHRLVGRGPTHLDSHQHVHLREPVRSVLLNLAREAGLPLRDLTPGIRYCGAFYGQTATGSPRPDAITVERLIQILAALPPGLTELGTHPGFMETAAGYAGERALEVQVLCDPRARAALAAEGITLCSFNDGARPAAPRDGTARRDHALTREGAPVRILVAGWFSFEQEGATVGHLLARDLTCDWLRKAGLAFDVALAPPFDGGIDWRAVDPALYSHVVFTCGPCGEGRLFVPFLQRFERCRLVGLNLSMLESLDRWNPFDVLLERDSSAAARPDISFLSHRARVPVVALVLIDGQPEYKERDRHPVANAALRRLVASREIAAVNVDVRLDTPAAGFRSPAEVESIIARMDCVLTTRLHGLVLAIRSGVPAVVIDSVAGGAKILRQAETIGWPLVFRVDDLTDEALRVAFEYSLTAEARAKAKECCHRAVRLLDGLADQFIAGLSPG